MIQRVFIEPKAYAYLESRRIVPQFRKAVSKPKSGDNAGLDFKKRKPVSVNVWSFRITKKYRAFARKKGETLTVFVIDDHQ